jgi:hypothetical protein
LVAQGFSGPGGHDDEGVLAFADAFDDGFLMTLEPIKAKKFPQGSAELMGDAFLN